MEKRWHLAALAVRVGHSPLPLQTVASHAAEAGEILLSSFDQGGLGGQAFGPSRQDLSGVVGCGNAHETDDRLALIGFQFVRRHRAPRR